MGERGKDCLPLKIKQKSSETLAAHRSDFRCRNVLLAVLSEGGFFCICCTTIFGFVSAFLIANSVLRLKVSLMH